MAIDHSMKSRDIIRSDWFIARYNHLFQLKADQNNKKEYENDHTGKRIVTSIGGSITGKHADIFIVDDPIDPLKATSEVSIKKCNKWWTKTVSTRMTNRKVSLKIIVMQRLEEEDLTGYVLNRNPDNYELICLPGELTKDVRPEHLRDEYIDGLFDVNRYDKTVLEGYEGDLGAVGYAGQILQAPAPVEGNLMKRKWFGRFKMSSLEERARKNAETLVWNFTFDGAYTKNEDNDPSAMLAYCIFENEMYIRAVMAVWKEMPELLEWMPEFAKQNGYTTASRIYVEPKANGLSAVQMLKRQTMLNVIIDKAPTTDKTARANTSSPYVQSKRVNLLEDAEWVEPFITEVITFPNAKHDDRMDCLTMAVDKIDPRSAVHSIEIM
ncbi:MAG: phage terminase large subunit [Mariprofundaceae bacterium]|nr:phage terminase large subunit [Mariprofundaceae bacterium]